MLEDVLTPPPVKQVPSTLLTLMDNEEADAILLVSNGRFWQLPQNNLFPQLDMNRIWMLLVGIPGIIAFVTIQTLLQQETEDAYRGRIFGAFGTTITLLMLLGSGVGGVLTDLLGGTALMSSAAIIYIIAGLLAAALLIKQTQKVVTSV